MKKRKTALLFLLPGLAALLLISGSGFAQEAPRITKEEVRSMIGKPEVVIIDVRQGADWKASEVKIKGAVREDAGSVPAWMDKYPKDKTLIFYCA